MTTQKLYTDHSKGFQFEEPFIANDQGSFIEEVTNWAKFRQFEDEVKWGTRFCAVRQTDTEHLGLTDLVGMVTFLIHPKNIDICVIYDPDNKVPYITDCLSWLHDLAANLNREYPANT